jgi:tetratricopeptide (TPR) repeat protein
MSQQQQQLDEARELLRIGRYDAALARLDQCDEWASPVHEHGLLLRAEILLACDPIDALEALARISDLVIGQGHSFEYYILSGRAYANARNFESASEMFSLAQRNAGEDAERLAVVAHQRSRLRYLQGNFDAGDPDLDIALGNPNPSARMFTLVVRSWMHAGLGNYRAQITDLRAAVDIARRNPRQIQLNTTGRALHSLVRVSYELGDHDASDDALALYEEIEWPVELAETQFLCLRALAWDAFLRGDSARAQWLLRDSKVIAPSDAWRVMSHVDRAYVAQMNHNEPWARDEILQAQAHARTVVWAATNGEERQALVTLAVLFAPLDMGQAQRYVSTYMRLGSETVHPSLAIAHDRRAAAFAQYAQGRVHQVLGNTEIATSAFENAYRIFDESEHHFRAALAAQGLSELTGATVWAERARQHAGFFPKSAFYRFLTDRISRQTTPWIEGLTPMQRQLALSLCEGLEMPALSRRFSRSEFTIKREVQALYDLFNVRTRNGLRELLEERGVL